MRTIRLLLLLLAFAAALAAQAALDNATVVKLVKSGLSEDLIVSMINSQPGKYQTSADDVIALKQAGVSDRILGAMIARTNGVVTSAAGSAAAAAAPPVAGTTAAAPAAGPVNEIGVYYKKGDEWKDLEPEVVNWKTGGVLKSIGTAGIVKGDVNGHVNGAHSPNDVKTPIDILVYAPEGVSITEYQLLHLREHADSREFRTVTGGVMHVSGGTTRDLIPFESTKIAPRTWTVTLPNIGPGDYGLLPPGANTSRNAASIGKIYSFHVIE